MHILITGIHGFVGSNLTASLKGQHTVFGLDIIAPEKEGVVRTYTWQELEFNLLPRFDAIIHLAGKAHDTKNQSEREAYFEINTGLTRKIFEYFLQSDAKKFIHFSTVKAAAEKVAGVLTEDVNPSPIGPYGESKLAAEKYLLLAFENAPRSTLHAQRLYILRPCMIHGPGNKGNLNLLYKMVQKGIPWPLGAFENRRSFTSVENLNFVIERLISDQVESGIYNMADDESLSTNELIKVICNSLGRRPLIWNLPVGFIKYMAKMGGILHLPLNPERLRKLTESYVVANSKIKNALGIEQMPVTAREGLEATLKSFH